MLDMINFPQQVGLLDLNPALVVIPNPPPPTAPGEYLLENSAFLLLENNGYLELEG